MHTRTDSIPVHLQSLLNSILFCSYKNGFARARIDGAALLKLDRAGLAKLVGASGEARPAFERLVAEVASCVDSAEQSPERVSLMRLMRLMGLMNESLARV
jgi:hypothetical protein